MKPLNEYPTPETDRFGMTVERRATSVDDDYQDAINHARSLEQRLAACRFALANLMGVIMETRGPNAFAALENAKETLAATRKP